MSSVLSQGQSQNIAVPRPVVEERWRKATPWLITFLGLVARLYKVEANGLRTDEAYSLWMASRTIPDLLRTVIIEGHDATPPTFNLMLHFIRLVSQEIWAMRIISVLAGAALVWATFQFALKLFDFRTALLSALLLVLSPFSIEYSQIARAYSLSALLAFLSVSYFASMRISPKSRSSPWLYGFTTVAAFSTHYLAGMVVIFENLVMAVLSVLRRVSREALIRWIRIQIVMALAALPVIWLALRRFPMSAPGSGQTWLASPNPLGMVRTLILWGTGDPSYGPTGFTVMRLAALLLLVGILGLGALTMRRLWTAGAEHREEVLRIAFVWSAFLTPWLLALGISIFRKVFNEKYFLYMIPFLLVLLSWSVLRIRPAILGRGLLVALLGITLFSSAIYYSSPGGEQWREALTDVRQEAQDSDFVAVVPGFYIRPVSYYLTGALPPHDYRLVRAPIVILGPGGPMPVQSASTGTDLLQAKEVIGPAERLWLITGYADVAPSEVAWFFENYEPVSQQEYVGVRVILGERK